MTIGRLESHIAAGSAIIYTGWLIFCVGWKYLVGTANRRASKHAFLYLRVLAGLTGWRLYTQVFLGVHGVTVRWPRTKGTAINERVHSFCGFLPNPFIQDLFVWRTSQEFVKTDLYPLSLISLRYMYAVCSTGRWSILGHCIGACQRSNCVEERRP